MMKKETIVPPTILALMSVEGSPTALKPVGTDEGCAVSNLSSVFEGGTVGDPEGITDGTLEGTLEGTIEGVLDGHDEEMFDEADDGDCDG